MPEGTEEQPGNEEKAPPAVVIQTPPPKVEEKAVPAGTAATHSPEKQEPSELGDDDEIPADAKLVKLSPRALNARLDRHTKRELVARFGTDDHVKIKADLSELETLRAEKEETRRASLSREQKLQEDKDAAEAKLAEAEAKLRRAEDRQVFSEYDRQASDILAQHLAPKHVKRAIRELKEHVLGLDDEELEGEGKAQKVFDEWVKDFVKENPEFAKADGAAPPAVKKIPLQTGAKVGAHPNRENPDFANKTARPGQPNSMTRAEFQAHKRRIGIS